MASDCHNKQIRAQHIKYALVTGISRYNNRITQCYISNCKTSNGVKTPKGGKLSLNKVSKSADFIAYPVPFDETLTVEYKFEYETDVEIQVYDTKGMLISRETDAEYRKGEIKTKQLNLSRVADQALIIKLISNQEVMSKMVISKSIR